MFACYTAKIDEFEADMDAIPYIRFSDPKQEKGHSKERQTQESWRSASARAGRSAR